MGREQGYYKPWEGSIVTLLFVSLRNRNIKTEMLGQVLRKASKQVPKYRASCAYFSTCQKECTRVAVVLSGNGVFDGSEVHEASAVLVQLSRAGADPECYAPDVKQMHVINHLKGAPADGEERNVLVESARIARSAIKPLSELTADKADAVVFPGGFGAAKNLSNFAVAGKDMVVLPDVERVIKEFHSCKKPIGLVCIAPILAAKVIPGVTITLGMPDDGCGKWPHAGAIDAAKALGAKVVHKNVTESSVDTSNLVVTTPAFMYEGKFHEIHDGVGTLVKCLMQLLRK